MYAFREQRMSTFTHIRIRIIIFIPPNQITSTSTCISGYQFPTNLFYESCVQICSPGTFSERWHEGPKLAPFEWSLSPSMYPPFPGRALNHRWVSTLTCSRFVSHLEKCLVSHLTWVSNSLDEPVLGKLVPVFNDFHKSRRQDQATSNSSFKKSK